MMRKTVLAIVLAVSTALQVVATAPDSVRYYQQESDTACITRIINETRAAELESTARRIVFIARQLMGTPYVAGTLEGEGELLTINTSGMDCTTFVENVIALALTTAEEETSCADYEKNLQSIRYRGGVVDGYSSRLHYVSDWIADNSERGNFTEVSSMVRGATRKKISLNYMTLHRRSYQALRDDAEYAKMQEIEKRYSNYAYSYIPKQMLDNPATSIMLKEGDIILFTTTTQGLDVSHMGILVMEKGRPHLIHASTRAKKVVLEPIPLQNYLNNNKNINGIRIVRVQ